MLGYDYNLIDSFRHLITTPLTVLGGAGTMEHIKKNSFLDTVLLEQPLGSFLFLKENTGSVNKLS